nr:immunoglobulin heavy chain junction region [Mus musculus]MBK4196984.1 immunoglobulin heavy chain junction region [Mus musculus]
CARFGGYDYPL